MSESERAAMYAAMFPSDGNPLGIHCAIDCSIGRPCSQCAEQIEAERQYLMTTDFHPLAGEILQGAR